MKKIIQVAAGIIFNEKKEILIAERTSKEFTSGEWEFPGGKLEKDELFFQALRRELSEEIGIEVQVAYKWLQVAHEYTERFVILEAWIVKKFLGIPKGLEGQCIRWVSSDTLKNYLFPEGNRILLERFHEIVI